MIEPLLGTDGAARLRADLLAADFTDAGLTARLDAGTAGAVRRGEAARVRRRLATADDPLAVLVRLFLAGARVPVPVAAAALPSVPLESAIAAGLLVADGDTVRAGVEVQPYGDVDAAEPWWIVADLPAALRDGPLPRDHVLGVGGASTTLALATMRTPVRTALDLGTGCGVQALHLSRHAGTVTGTDISTRALRFAATTAALSGQRFELLAGDLVAPVAGRRYDLVVSNPPFIVGPTERAHYTYRDSGRAGDAVVAELIAALPALLADGGHAQFLANWIHPARGDWAQRLAELIAPTGLDAWVIQREVSTPEEYVRLWLADTGEDGTPAGLTAASAAGNTSAGLPAASAAGNTSADDWLDWFAAEGIEAVGFGIVSLRAGGHADPTIRIEDLRQPTDPIGGLVPEWFARADWLRAHPGTALLGARLRPADTLALHTESRLTDDGWAGQVRRFALDSGARYVEETDELVAALVAGCRGLPLGDVLDLLAAGYGLDRDLLVATAVPVVAGLIERGILLPAN
ncbi:DUF7059 domain-containing protein [Actinocatenispora sera]|uniref:SAM-dependent methyltransferase n=1 Tax=Actinocatenispora sera TaxID=390989 RepID=A0A810L665_9ACTN|nr:methyltransferase [Actinocatenispora sera]BCJ29856.1 SAM-dependent methyltransferase [Actinocatenispora sera]